MASYCEECLKLLKEIEVLQDIVEELQDEKASLLNQNAELLDQLR